jgi:predicted CXXCH cytochrome family protein
VRGAHHREVKRATPLGLVAALPILLALGPGERAGPGAIAGGDICELRLADRARTTSRSCLACHDGSIATGRMARAHEGSGAHPVDVDYLASRARRPGLRAPGALPPGLVLVNGTVACTTCHDPRSSERAKTALPMGRSAMCFGCHDI